MPEPTSEDYDSAANGGTKVDKKAKAKARKQQQKLNKQLRRQEAEARKQSGTAVAAPAEKKAEDDDIVIEYVSAPLEFGSSEVEDSAADDEMPTMGLGLGFTKAKEDPFAEFKKVFEKFASAEQVTGAAPLDDEDEQADQDGEKEERVKEEAKATTSAPDSDDEEDKDGKKLSRKQRKMLNQLKIAELKQLCERPDVVEVWDVTSTDPQLLVFLKAYRNTVSVPRHWSQKRKYLQGKRGIEKPPFKLPDFIEATGIGDMRQAYSEKEDAKKLKAKQREKMAPKMGRMDIDYQVLHDAFFKYQTRPKLTTLGEVYYEGKEYEARVEGVKPGVLSDELRKALGMTDDSPPPWLINMQRYGPPPSYPNLRVPGLNAPIPPGAQFGYHAGGWGKPPVDEAGNPLYGDVFGQHVGEGESDDEVEKQARWGEMEVVEEESEEEESEEEGEEEEDEDAMQAGIASGMASGMVSGLASGIASSLPSGIETPDVSVQLRKGAESSEPRQLYQVLEQKAAPIGQATLLGTDHVYVIPGQEKKKPAKPGVPGMVNDVEVALTPEEMEGLDEEGIRELYETKLAEARAANKREDFSDLVAAKAAQQKRKAQQKADASKKQKTGGFKF
uniref:PSP proline-rich domain-containing protein n=1 Tax=Chlamydomonas leiostraca TaxID=1034604 RepID=A0A7S0RWY4_9CHLO|mmetsp:Transcript_33872/g.85742  ORF Transcript_33872/g.85742 Transcript_33872/m.85742 type:complete len:615 (+) Transcript_33872:141-1985(+)|eukprot:CAMPEP_0202887142 /NCGR_PEP_ID=MMETSP1391-20130828/42530_1 /ASSEMBLY_ACC=CAM_ASM_000867 /TAXON_ID=1034604 /ORGANISM="Chlamydomonas leiostraca, Strain SAG 11-49" /LENGTH=614 /DNA_ID=CAMNT_0049570419 /DNA_START=117 /DNA_END=1961 /DNA_ORIENTATION=+